MATALQMLARANWIATAGDDLRFGQTGDFLRLPHNA
jgi:hypothetical protein